MKKFRKLIVALLAMTMALGCLTMTASAADYTDGGKLYIVGTIIGTWDKQEAMTGSNGVYTYELELKAGTYEYKFTTTGDWKGTQIRPTGADGEGSNFKYTAEKDGTYVVTVDTSKVTKGNSDNLFKGDTAVTVVS